MMRTTKRRFKIPLGAYAVIVSLLGERLYLRLKYRYRTGRWPNLNAPERFSEKLQWLKLYDRRPLMHTLADKLAAKEWVSGRVGSEYVIPVKKVIGAVENLTMAQLPDFPFVLKFNHDSGGVKVCRSEADFDLAAMRAFYTARNRSFYPINLEWEYKGITPTLFAEEYIDDPTNSGVLRDYKIHCFAGEPRLIQVLSDRWNQIKEDWLRPDWQPVDFWYVSAHRAEPERPNELAEMLALARRLSQSFPYVRVDLYVTGDRILVGEFTFRPYGGFMQWKPDQADLEVGRMLTLPEA